MNPYIICWISQTHPPTVPQIFSAMLQRIETGLAQGTCVRGAQQDTPKAVFLNPGLAYVKLKQFELQLLLYLTINIYKYLEIKYLEG